MDGAVEMGRIEGSETSFLEHGNDDIDEVSIDADWGLSPCIWNDDFIFSVVCVSFPVIIVSLVFLCFFNLVVLALLFSFLLLTSSHKHSNATNLLNVQFSDISSLICKIQFKNLTNIVAAQLFIIMMFSFI